MNLIQSITSLTITESSLLLIIVFVLFYFSLNLSKFIANYDFLRSRNINSLNNALKSDKFDGISKEHLEAELEKKYFYFATGINLEKENREALIKLHKSSNGNIHFAHFKRAIPFLSFQDAKITFEKEIKYKIFYYSLLIAGVIMLFGGLLLILIPLFINNLYNPLPFYLLTGPLVYSN